MACQCAAFRTHRLAPTFDQVLFGQRAGGSDRSYYPKLPGGTDACWDTSLIIYIAAVCEEEKDLFEHDFGDRRPVFRSSP